MKISAKAIQALSLLRLLRNLFLAIPFAFVVAAVLWFFEAILFQLDNVDFFSLWKWSYIGLLSFDVLLAFLWVLTMHWLIFRAMRRFDVKFTDAEASVLDYKFYIRPDYKQWDKSTFEKELSTERWRKSMAEVVKAALGK